MTVHNLAFPGKAPPECCSVLVCRQRPMAIDGVEFHGAISFLKAGLQLADRITTVSPTYAAEIQTEAGAWGSTGLLRGRAVVLSGILNGIDTDDWDPDSRQSPRGTVRSRRRWTRGPRTSLRCRRVWDWPGTRRRRCSAWSPG